MIGCLNDGFGLILKIIWGKFEFFFGLCQIFGFVTNLFVTKSNFKIVSIVI